ncbi:MAG: two-component sensor histidine kinase [Acidisphaera sp.]|nr:two-component sensor histidine kinase [Acidisphaera sp.]
MRAALIAGAIAGVPVLALAGLALAGLTAVGPALLAIALVVLAALALAGVFVRDAHRLAAGLHGAAVAPLLPPLAGVGREAEQLARELARRRAELDRRSRADEAIIECLPDPLLVLGADGAVRRRNAAAAALGPELGAVLRHPALRAAIERARAQHAPHTAELALPVPVARDLLAVVLSPPALRESGQIVVVISDRTRERAIERMRADFVANASHELRTPLAGLIGFIDTLRGPAADDPPAQQRFLAIMAEQAGRMNRLIDDLLSLSRIELTEHLPPADRVDLPALIARVAAGFEPRLAQRRMSLQLTLAAATPALPGDADQLAQVVQNLLDNAVKYAREKGTVRISAGPAGEGRWPGRAGVTLSVADDGPGIPRTHLPRLTERFYRVDQGRSRAAGGTGLGLAIVKHIVNRHRGQLVIESEEGKGASFTVWLPLA